MHIPAGHSDILIKILTIKTYSYNTKTLFYAKEHIYANLTCPDPPARPENRGTIIGKMTSIPFHPLFFQIKSVTGICFALFSAQEPI
jgi:hypothetical protein